jgi:hypothetical protein
VVITKGERGAVISERGDSGGFGGWGQGGVGVDGSFQAFFKHLK